MFPIGKYRTFILYGIALAAILFLMQWLELRFIIYDHALEIYAGLIALLFTALGIWLATRLMRPKTLVVEKTIYRSSENFILNEAAVKEFDLTKRELEVLELMAKGLSNAEIGKQLYLSEHTVKSHSANLFFKMEVKRRTQAVEKGKRTGLIP